MHPSPVTEVRLASSKARPLRRWLIGLSVVAVIAFAFGPRVSMEIGNDPILLPGDLDAELAWQETQWSDLVSGTEKIVRWQDSESQLSTPISFVYIHGFSASRQEVAPLVDSLADRFGANAFFTRLTGHGRTTEAMRESSVKAWTQDSREAVVYGSLIGERVVLIGTSTGGSLAAWVASQPQYRSNVAGLILISPNLGPKQPLSGLLTMPWGLQLARLLTGGVAEWEPVNAGQRRYWTERVPAEALPPMMASVKLARASVGEPWPFPVLVLTSTEDQVVDQAKTREWFDLIESPQAEWVEYGQVGDPSSHVIAGDILSPDNTPVVLDAISRFLVEAGVSPFGGS